MPASVSGLSFGAIMIHPWIPFFECESESESEISNLKIRLFPAHYLSLSIVVIRQFGEPAKLDSVMDPPSDEKEFGVQG